MCFLNKSHEQRIIVNVDDNGSSSSSSCRSDNVTNEKITTSSSATAPLHQHHHPHHHIENTKFEDDPVKITATTTLTTPMNPLLESALLEIRQAEESGTTRQEIEAWNSLGLIRLHTQRNPQEALKYHMHALNLCSALEQDGDDTIMETSNTYGDIGLCYERLGEDKEALRCYEKAYSLLIETNNVSECHPRLIGLKRVLARLGRV